jgi:hypothetical protein
VTWRRLTHDLLISGRPSPTAVLSVLPTAAPVRELYLGRGWTVLTEAFPTDGPAYWIMGRKL